MKQLMSRLSLYSFSLHQDADHDKICHLVIKNRKKNQYTTAITQKTHSKRLTFSYLAAASRTSTAAFDLASSSSFSSSTMYFSRIFVYPPLH